MPCNARLTFAKGLLPLTGHATSRIPEIPEAELSQIHVVQHHEPPESGFAWHSNCPQATSQAQFAMPQGSLLFFRPGLEVAASPTSRVQEEAAHAHRVMHDVLGAKGG